MTYYRVLVPLAVLTLSVFAQAQRTGDVKIRIVFTDSRACNIQVRVELMSSASTTPVAQTYTNSEGMASFVNVVLGNYHIIVSGEGIQETDSGMFEVDARKASQYLFVTVKRTGEDSEDRAKAAGGPAVSATALNIPENARKEFDKASLLIAKEDWQKAKEQLGKTISIYPNYAAAYNNLGVVEGRLGDRPNERQALLKAISIDGHFSPAYVNLAKMSIIDRDFPSAEAYLTKATSADPTDGTTLTLLANMQLMNQRYDEAIATCRRLHSIPQHPHALGHYIAARALEHENRPADAESELQMFLAEESTGLRADAVRKELAALQNPTR